MDKCNKIMTKICLYACMRDIVITYKILKPQN